MIKNIIFDFGDIFINLDKQVVFRALQDNGIQKFLPKYHTINEDFEVGKISPQEFVERLQPVFPHLGPQAITDIWNSMLLDFPEYRLNFLENLAKENSYRLFLLSNTNALHIPHVIKIMGNESFGRFKSSFEQFYLSHEIQLRKPNHEIFQYVLEQNRLEPKDTLFIDDTKENTDAARELGIKTWNLIVGKEDVVNLKERL
ncbi:HAD family hydrolase [Arenibacter algicola]|uniref:D-ribitol-5-phosphate phosphatase n=1 Tax=Arenibacter algicola TaxID=616991 RepID=A0A221V3A0_9FLAO|nr:HAD family phosphatase [Arenibacter algicola]ASO08064.1 D-ribitol-5-phosphate phosphatase [Arenibacter algicola]|tara:strand:- start:1928 stop:2530 length:603 start_codon:yes stop_codon:yes gene_type:complete